MKIIQILLFLFFFTSCNQKASEDNTKLEIEALKQKDVDSNTQINQSDLITTIEFGVKAEPEDAKDFEDGIIPWINIEKPENQINRLIDADKVVITDSEVTLVIDYPLNKPTEFILKNSGKGFTKKQLVLEISKKYHEIYEAEESSAKTKTIPAEKREGLINRNETNGKYGICCHDIGDLDLSSAQVYKTEDGKIKIVLEIES
jgi:hypothetical protein